MNYAACAAPSDPSNGRRPAPKFGIRPSTSRRRLWSQLGFWIAAFSAAKMCVMELCFLKGVFAMWGIIGGSGFEKFDGFEVVKALPRATPFGDASSGFKKVKVGGKEALFLSRHGEHHEMLPTEINYRANIYALKAAG